MAKSYTDTPGQFSEIEPYILQSIEEIGKELILSPKCYFYDACSFRKHVHLKHPEFLFEYIKKTNGIVIITRCILMELCSENACLPPEYVEYFRKMHESGIKIIVFFEEEVFNILAECFTSNADINDYLSVAVKTIKTPTGTVTKTLESDKKLFSDIILKSAVAENKLFSRFFKAVRQNKESGDNLGEEMIAICVHLLSNIPEKGEYKWVIMTEDKGAIGLFMKALNNVYQHLGKYTFSVMTTPKLAQRLFETKIISEEEQIKEVLAVGLMDDSVRILGSEEYDLNPKLKSMSSSELACMIAASGKIHINY